MEKIFYTKPSITDLEVRYATDAANNGWGEHCYDYILKFQDLFKDYIEVKYAIATSSCTGALHMGLAASGIGPGDEVIIPDTSWIATAAPVTYLGAKPVFVDILPDTWCIDPAKIEEAVTPRTKAIIAVHLYGNLCEMDTLLKIGKKYGIPIIEDAAEAIGSVYHGKCAGSMGDFGVFSFHGTKTITTGEGGIFVTNDDAIYKKVLAMSNHGRFKEQPKQFWPDIIGFKYKMSNIQAAIGCAQIERVNELVERKKEIFKFYYDNLSGFQGVAMNPEKPGTSNGYWTPVIVFDRKTGISREDLQRTFAEKNIDARVFFGPLSSLPMFKAKTTNVVSYDICKRAINLPSYHDMTKADQLKVVEVLTFEGDHGAVLE
jgi:perosamine synthetase